MMNVEEDQELLAYPPHVCMAYPWGLGNSINTWRSGIGVAGTGF